MDGAAHSAYERAVAVVVSALYVMAGVAGTLTIVEAVGRSHGMDMAVLHRMKTRLASTVKPREHFGFPWMPDCGGE